MVVEDSGAALPGTAGVDWSALADSRQAGPMSFQITVRYGTRHHRYHTHERNVTDEQIRASAATGGVVCVSGVSIFLGTDAPDADDVARHADLVEMRPAVDPDARSYLGEDG